jgi:hypothetical protein
MKKQLLIGSFAALYSAGYAQNFNPGAGTNNSIYRDGKTGFGMTTAPASNMVEVETTTADDGIMITQKNNNPGIQNKGSAALYLNNYSGHKWGVLSTGSDNNIGGSHYAVYDMTLGLPRFFIHGTNGNTGIGTATPLQKLDVAGNMRISGAFMPNNSAGAAGQVLQSAGANAAPVWVTPAGGGLSGSGSTNYLSKWSGASSLASSQLYDNGSKVSIGHAGPQAKLDIRDGSLADLYLYTVANSRATLWTLNNLNSYGFQIDAGGTGNIVNGLSTQYKLMNFEYSGNAYCPGRVWIGKKPTSAHTDFNFAVGGKIVAQSVYVTMNVNWADYVFEEDYKLPSLAQVESFYKANKHLPEVPTAAQVQEQGIDVGEMNTLLLKKVEELTLYVVELNKSVETLKKQNAELTKK